MTVPRTPARKSSSPASRDPYGVALRRPILAPVPAAAGLGISALLTIALFTGSIPFLPTGGGTAAGGGGTVSRPAGATPKPDVVETNKQVEFPGSLVYVKAGNLWIQVGTDAKQLTKTGADTDPAWSHDGEWIYFITHKSRRGLYQTDGRPAYYDLVYPILMRIRPDGTGREELLSGLVEYAGKSEWHAFMLDPDPAPDGKTIALVSDLPDPTDSNVVLQTFNLATGKLTPVPVPENPPLGHQDPAYSPDGKTLLYVMNARDGARGAPAIWRWLPAKKRFAVVSGPGYSDPAWSPDGRLIAATRTDSFGTDVVILDAKTGAEIEGVTNDGRSWAPTWSPRGDQLVYMHLEGLAVDLRIVQLAGTGTKVTVTKVDPLTDFAGLDGASRATWFVPASELPAASPSPAASPAASPADSAAP